MCRYIQIKNSTQTGSFRTGTITPFTVILGIEMFARICAGYQNLCLVCIQFEIILRHPCTDVGNVEAYYILLYKSISYIT